MPDRLIDQIRRQPLPPRVRRLAAAAHACHRAYQELHVAELARARDRLLAVARTARLLARAQALAEALGRDWNDCGTFERMSFQDAITRNGG